MMLNTGEFLMLAIITLVVFSLRDLPRLGDSLGHLFSGRFLKKK